MIKKFRKPIALLLTIMCLLSCCFTAFAAKNKETNTDAATTATAIEEKAKNYALSAARSAFMTQGKLTNEQANKAQITKMKYDKKNDAFKFTIRSEYGNKFTCVFTVIDVFGKQILNPADTQFKKQNVVAGWFGQGFEKIGWWFIRIFHGDIRTAE